MNPNVTLDELAPDEFEVYIRSNFVGVVWMDLDGYWIADDGRGPAAELDTKEEAVNWLVGW